MSNEYFKRRDTGQLFFRKVILSMPFLAFLFIIFILFSISTARVYLESKRIYNAKILKEEQFKKEEERNKELNQKIAEIKSEEGTEKQLREKFQIKKEGEEVVVLVNPKTNNNEEVVGGKNFIGRFFRWVFNK